MAKKIMTFCLRLQVKFSIHAKNMKNHKLKTKNKICCQNITTFTTKSVKLK